MSATIETVRLGRRAAFAAAMIWARMTPGFSQCPPEPYNVPTRTLPIIQPRTGTQTLANPLVSPASVKLTMVAFGDSVVWGDGLKNPNKFVELAGAEIANKTQRPVEIISYAHSGAKLALAPPVDPPRYENGYGPIRPSDQGYSPGDLNSGFPNVPQQVDCAAKTYPQAEIVVLDGCINDVDAFAIALPPIINSVKKVEIERRAFAYCGAPMAKTLAAAKAAFPRATIIVLSYYQIVSPDSSIFGMAKTQVPPGTPDDGSSAKQAKRLAKHYLKMQKLEADSKGVPPPSKKIDAEAIQKWPENSTAFRKTSHGCLQWAINATDPAIPPANAVAEPNWKCPPVVETAPSPEALKAGSRVYLAVVPDNPAFAYGAKQRHLWILPFQFWFLAWNLDDMYRDRNKLCKTHYDGHDFKGREGCRVNPTAHPNREGATAYACSIVNGSAWKCDATQAGILDQAWALK